jgi:hypothetical protein
MARVYEHCAKFTKKKLLVNPGVLGGYGRT